MRFAPEPPRICRRLHLLRGWGRDEENQRPRYAPQIRERTVRMIVEHGHGHSPQWACILSIAGKTGRSAQTLHNRVSQAERESGGRSGPTREELARIKALERENRELRQANEILRKASAHFAQAELDRRFKPKTGHDRLHRRSWRFPERRALKRARFGASEARSGERRFSSHSLVCGRPSRSGAARKASAKPAEGR